jgi:hypothetical protein
MTSDQFVDVDDSAARAVPAPPASGLMVPPPSAVHARMDEDADLLSDRDVVRLFTTGRRPAPVRMWLRRLQRPARD